MADAQLKVTQHRSAIGSKPKQRGTLRALGHGRIGRSHLLPDRPEIRGMIARVPHLVTVEEVSAPTKKAAAKKAPAKKAAEPKAEDTSTDDADAKHDAGDDAKEEDES